MSLAMVAYHFIELNLHQIIFKSIIPSFLVRPAPHRKCIIPILDAFFRLNFSPLKSAEEAKKISFSL